MKGYGVWEMQFVNSGYVCIDSSGVYEKDLKVRFIFLVGRRSSVVVFSVRCCMLQEVGSFWEFFLQGPFIDDKGFYTRG